MDAVVVVRNVATVVCNCEIAEVDHNKLPSTRSVKILIIVKVKG
jgi:hypothetical protein